MRRYGFEQNDGQRYCENKHRCFNPLHLQAPRVVVTPPTTLKRKRICKLINIEQFWRGRFGDPRHRCVWSSRTCWQGWRLGTRFFEMRFDFLQSLAFRFWQERDRSDEVDNRARGKAEEHGCVSVFSDGGQEHGGDRRRDSLVNQQGNTYAVGANPGGHQFRKREPNAPPRTDCIKRHKNEESDRYQPAVVRAWHGS